MAKPSVMWFRNALNQDAMRVTFYPVDTRVQYLWYGIPPPVGSLKVETQVTADVLLHLHL
jgi:hypothetical protein